MPVFDIEDDEKISPCSLTDKAAVFGTADEGSIPPTGTELIFEFTGDCERITNLQSKLSTLTGCTKQISETADDGSVAEF